MKSIKMVLHSEFYYKEMISMCQKRGLTYSCCADSLANRAMEWLGALDLTKRTYYFILTAESDVLDVEFKERLITWIQQGKVMILSIEDNS